MRILPFLPSFSPSLVCHKNTKESFATIRSNSEHNPGEEEEDEEDEEGGEEGDEEYEIRRPQRKGGRETHSATITTRRVSKTPLFGRDGRRRMGVRMY